MISLHGTREPHHSNSSAGTVARGEMVGGLLARLMRASFGKIDLAE
jgi:hypothetical protein